MFNPFRKKSKKQPDLVSEVVEKIMLPVVYDADLEKALNETFRPAFIGDDAAIEDESGVLNVDILRYYARANFRLTPQIQEELIKYWAINRACLMPVQDCLRNWYELVAEEQESVPEQVSKAITHFNKEFDLPKKLEDALYYSRVYGIRVCIFQFEGLTSEHYENPINWDTLKNHKYKGFFMLSPQYCIPVQFEVNDPMRFRQVNYWKAANQKYHHSWVRLIHHCEVPANQLPMYLGGGVSLVQEIYEKVYQADQTANEALQILFTKNLTVRKGDTASAIMNQAEFEQKMSFFARMTGQFRQLFISTDEDYQNIERSLQGVEDLFAKYYEIVAAVAKIPNNRFMMTQLTGFAASGEAEDRIYNSSNLSTLQVKLNPLIEMHNKAILVTNGLNHENITIEWNKCGALTEAELADIQGKRIANDVQLVQSQIIAPDKAAERLAKDKDSGYAGIDLLQPEMGNNPLEGLDFSMFANVAQVGDGEPRWVTVGKGKEGEKGHKFKIDDETGVILAGGSPEMKGKTFNEAFRTEKNALASDIAQAAVKKHGKGTVGEYLRGGAHEMANQVKAFQELTGVDPSKQLSKAQYQQGSTIGRSNTVKTAKGTKVETKFKVIDASELIASHDIHGNHNPKFPQELQPRDRSKGTSQQWVQKTAKQLDTSSLGFSTRADTGAPIVGSDNVVESGNGRSMAMLHAYNTGNAENYREWLTNEAAELGIDPETVKGMKQPILVRERVTDLDRRTFTKEANEDDKLSMSATEKALSDADKLDDSLVSKIQGEGNLRHTDNKEFIRAFLATLSDSDAAQYYTKSGKLTRSIYDRVQSAVFAKAYNDDRLLEMMADDDKSEIKNIIGALNMAAPAFIQAKNISAKDHKKVSETLADGIELSLDEQTVNTLVEATNAILESKNKGLTLEEYLAQSSVFGESHQISEDAAAMAIFIKDNNRSAAKMGEAFKTMADFIIKDAENRQTDDLLGEPEPLDLKTVIRAAGVAVKEQEKAVAHNKPKQPTGGFIDPFTETRGQKKEREKWLQSQQTTDSRPLQAGDVIDLDGYNVLIENPKGSVRKWTDSAGRSGESVLTCHYGELQGYTGADDDYLDVFIVD